MGQPTTHFYEFGPFRLDAIKRLLMRDGEAVPLKSKDFDMLLALVVHHGEVLDKDGLELLGLSGLCFSFLESQQLLL
ncbi:MAG: winged helix-turn-helix domain-containing protein, partial [Blastocatellia bacterium]